MLGTLLLSTGTPMLLAGDERWRTQRGNNNPYCLDDETSWVDWSAGPEAASLTAFTALVAGIRRGSPAPAARPLLPRRRGALVAPGRPPAARARLARRRPAQPGPAARGVAAAAARRRRRRCRRRCRPGRRSCPMLDSARPDGRPPTGRPLPGGTTITLPPRSLLLLRQEPNRSRRVRSVATAVPRYDFRCRECERTFEVTRPMSAVERAGALPRRATPTPSSCCPRWPSAGGPARPPRAAPAGAVAAAGAAAPDPAAHATRRVSATWC